MADALRSATSDELQAAKHLFDRILERHSGSGQIGDPDEMVGLWSKCLVAVTAGVPKQASPRPFDADLDDNVPF